MAPSGQRGYCADVTPRRATTPDSDILLAGLVGALYLVEIFSEGRFAGDRGLSVPVALLFAATLAARRSAPLLGLLAGVGVIVLSNNLVPALADTPAFLLGFAIAVYSTGRYAGGRSAPAGALAVVASLPLAVIEPGEPFSAADSAFIAIFILGPWVAGRVIRQRVERERDLEGRAAELEQERDAKAREAVVEERARIARELHDVVAHAISVIVLQARGGRRMLHDNPEDTRRALDAIEHAGEQALAEMRRLLEVLRRADEEPALAPRPGLSRIDELVAELTATGLPVEVTVEGEQFALSPGVDVTAYRIVQEGLTNALKHAGPARAHVILRYSPEELVLEVVDDGAGSGNGGGSGHGLAGIRERVAVYGGELESGRRPEGGYALRARLPLGSAP
jgi:signal transduction histidine kinase